MFAEPITAVIATRDRGKAIDAAAQSILANRHPALRLVVVDQSRDDASESALLGLRSDPRLTYLRSDTIGLSRARNIGLRLAETELVAFTDDDCEVSHDWLQKLQSVFEQHPEVAVVFCSVRPGPHDQTVGFIPSYECRGTRVIHTIAEKPRARGIGAGMAVRRQPVLVLGGFGEQLGAGARFPAGEDGDIAVRSLIGGFAVCETDRTFVTHHGFRTWAEGKHLARRDWLGIGAACAKPLRAGYWSFARVPVYELFVEALSAPMDDLMHLRRPRGMGRGAHFLRGFARGIVAPFDRDRLLFKGTRA